MIEPMSASEPQQPAPEAKRQCATCGKAFEPGQVVFNGENGRECMRHMPISVPNQQALITYEEDGLLIVELRTQGNP